MATASNNTLNYQNHCTICLEGLAIRTNVTLRCHHTFHLDCLGSAFNAANEMQCPLCREVEEGAWRTFPTRAPRISRVGAGLIQEDVQEPSVRMGHVGPNEHHDPYPQGMNSIQPVGLEAPDVALLGEPIFNNRASAGSLFGRLAGAAPVRQSMHFPSPPVCAMMRAANNRSSSSGLLPAEQTAFQAEGSGTGNIQLPDVGEVVLALSADVPPGDGIDGPEDIMSEGEE